jgi:NAD(P)H-binding
MKRRISGRTDFPRISFRRDIAPILMVLLFATISIKQKVIWTTEAFSLHHLPIQSSFQSGQDLHRSTSRSSLYLKTPRNRPKGTFKTTTDCLLTLFVSGSDNDDKKSQNNSSTSKSSTNKKWSSKTKKYASKKKKGKNKPTKKNNDPAQQKKQEIMQQIKAKLEEKRKENQNGNSDEQSSQKKPTNALGKLINPFQAGKDLRQTLGSLTTLGRGLSEATKQKYYLDDRFLDTSQKQSSRVDGPRSSASGILSSFSASSFLLEAVDTPNYVPEVLVIGATGEIGRLVVRRLLLEGRFQVRVLVRDLYSQTLNLLGTGVSYCQGDLNNVESLEYALTDVDKIVYVAGAPRPDEADFQAKFQRYLLEHDLKLNSGDDDEPNHANPPSTTAENLEWEQLESVLEVRAELAKQVDFVGIQNVISAYQNVRHADYGTSQAAKRSLFKFGSRPEDFNLFALDDDEDGSIAGGKDIASTKENDNNAGNNYQYEVDEDFEDFDYDDFDEEEYEMLLEARGDDRDAAVKTQVQWIRNQFGNAVFVGRVPKATSANMIGGEAAVVSSRLRSREDPEQGIDLSNGFAGFILRLVSDGNKYEAFVRTGLYETDGVEYICEFSTDTKRTSSESKSRNRFKTARLAFENFSPVKRKSKDGDNNNVVVAPPFDGNDVRYIGFRFRSSSNPSTSIDNRLKGKAADSFQSFYIALSYIKVYRVQPEPEFIFLSDARIPPETHSGMVQHDRQIVLTNQNNLALEDENTMTTTLFDEKTLQSIAQMERSPAETYFKYRGEDILKKSGLSYTIIRVAGFNELPTSEASTIDLVQSNTNLVPVSRSEVAQVCVSALMDPSALNKSVYMTKKKSVGNVWEEEDISAKFEAIPNDPAL